MTCVKMCILISFHIALIKYPDKNNLEDKGLILTQNSKLVRCYGDLKLARI